MLAAFGSGMEGAGFVFALSTVVLLFALAQMWRIEYRFAPEVTGADSGERMTARALLRETGDGFAYVWRDRRLRMVIGLIIPHCSLTMAFNSMLPRLATDVGGGSDTFTAILMGLGVGAILGTLAVSMVRQQVVQGYTLAVTGIASGLAMVVMGMASSPALVVVGAMLAGGTQATYMVISQTLVQQIVPDAMRGRVLSLFVALAAGHMAFVNLGSGWLADTVSVRPLMVIPGLLWVAIFAVGAFGLPELRHVLRCGDFRSRVGAAAAGDE
jgi:sugar phosphate permease